MTKFKVQITETSQRTIEVEAEDETAACGEAEVLWGDADIVLDHTHFVGVDYEVIE